MEDFKITLAAARVNKGMTQEEVAKLLDVSKQTIIAWEKGKSCPDGKTLFTMCELYSVPVQNIKFE